MRNVVFTKKCNPETLGAELAAAGFQIYGVSTIGDTTTIVHLNDSELKDPTATVNAHIYTPPTIKTAAAWKSELAAAATVQDKLDVLSKFVGLK